MSQRGRNYSRYLDAISGRDRLALGRRWLWYRRGYLAGQQAAMDQLRTSSSKGYVQTVGLPGESDSP